MNKSARQFHLQIVETLEQRILTGYYRPEEQFPTEHQLASEFGVSRGTVRKALHILENQGILARAAGKGTFITSNNIHAEKSGTTNLIGIAIPHRSDQLSSNILNGAERVAREKGFGLVFTSLVNDIVIEKEQVQRLKNQRVAGIIIFPIAETGEAQMLCTLVGSTPVVLVDRELPEFCGSVVMADNFHGAYSAVKHLQDLGHTRIVVVAHPTQASSVRERIRGYEQAMLDANLLPFSPIQLDDFGHNLPGVLPVYTEEELKWVDHMLSIPDRPTAIFCINDHLATGVMRLALAKGLRIPDDIAMVGFDNSQFAPLTPVPLTSVEQCGFEIGTKAAELLVRKISNPLEKDQKILLPTHLVVRASTVKEKNS
jgi:DNA-binding LacI/PurR family transcriptional regulator